MRTKKSFTSRLKVTKKGKIMSRSKGQCHYNAKDSGQQGIKKRKLKQASFITPKIKQQFLPYNKS